MIQNTVSKTVLQVLLGIMFACGVTTYVLVRPNTLWHNPCSIAGVASMLADSEVCSRNVIPEGAEWMSDRELKEAGVFEDWFFSLGWYGERAG